MKKLFILLSICAGILFVGATETKAQTTKIMFARGASAKTMSVTLAAGKAKSFSVQVREGQVINIGVSGDINVSKRTEFPVIYLGLTNGDDEIDRTQDGEAYLSILAGKNGTYIFSVTNSDKKRARTFKMEVKVTDDREDFAGGEEVEQ